MFASFIVNMTIKLCIYIYIVHVYVNLAIYAQYVNHNHNIYLCMTCMLFKVYF
jgi:hypothetical protein